MLIRQKASLQRRELKAGPPDPEERAKRLRRRQRSERSEEAYREAFERERFNEYPEVDLLEKAAGHAIGRVRLEAAAFRLACPVKANPPCWQQGRIIYATTMDWLAHHGDPNPTFLDIGTAKGFSALAFAWALHDSKRPGDVVSLDIIDPDERTFRNSVEDVRGPTTVRELLAPWPEAERIYLYHGDGAEWLEEAPNRYPIAYIDGRHDYEHVRAESLRIAARQVAGDLIIFDDLQVPGVRRAVEELEGYGVETITCRPERVYAIAAKRE